MSQITFSDKDIKKAKSGSAIYREDELRGINSVLKRHVIRLIKIAFKEYNPKPDEWQKFLKILRDIL